MDRACVSDETLTVFTTIGCFLNLYLKIYDFPKNFFLKKGLLSSLFGYWTICLQMSSRSITAL
jgi:hypothetical protein